MIKSIPSKLSRTKLIELLDMHCDKENKKVDEQYSESCQDMSDFRIGLNLENFTRSAGAVLFFKCYHNFDSKSFDSNKVCEIKLARVQGKQGLVMHFENSYFRCETNEYLPVKFSPAARDGSLSCAFPAGVTKNQKMSPNARPFFSSLQYNTKLLFSFPPYFPLPLPPPPSPVFEFHPPFAHHFVPLQYPMKPFSYFLPQPNLQSHTTTIIATITSTYKMVFGSCSTGLNLGYEFVYSTRLVGEVWFFRCYQYFAWCFESSKICEIKNILGKLRCDNDTTAPSRKCFCRQRITGSHLQCYS
ncbi:hypothetical protein GIB67_016333 [Kingdonia uniflora]|uniref:Mei2-like C-terminal RNA recognition motif domain-containing protein n=1 Tax=Kingdonia uniflora TaxID=39325 RepID=A0A7J7M9F7_9MAGN|nr:hypothetical protein GIB67_016333 [Kingdonia uniflora]